jgi:secondary thiamine-phosphate synthase enzyme
VSEVQVRTAARLDLVNISDRLATAVAESGVRDGLVCVSIPHSTAALIVNEDEDGLRQDILRLAEKTIEPLRRLAPFAHDRIDDNAAAHLTSIFFQPAITLPIAAGRPVLGTWQSLFLLDLDGPRTRTVRFTFVGK